LTVISRIEQSRALAAQARSQFFPQLGYQGYLSKGKNSAGGMPASMGGTTNDPAMIDLDAFWEVDIWGRIRRQNEAANAMYMATEWARRGVMLSLVAEVAQAYYELLELDLEMQIACDTKKSFSDTLKLFEDRFQGGIASELDVARARAALASAASTIPFLEQQILAKENQIAVLLGRNPEPVENRGRLLERTLLVDIPAGLPAQLLERRPDIRLAEENLKAANAKVGVAYTNFFPTISLTSFLGQVSPELSELSDSNNSAWGVLGGLAGPVFQGGRILAEYDRAKAEYEEYRQQYLQTIIVAFSEVSNALTAYHRLKEVRVEKQKAVTAYEEAVRMSTERYVAGKAGYYEVLDAQQQLFPAQNQLAQTDLAQRVSVVKLYKALGGGWSLPSEEWKKAQ
ncbi:MAG: efflux transporter outer membrane subunit, partial [Deltaproteobacteria bacterium]|nr:efflux transporter outer membrane subunit [Deltaproteobacteria bacterium]